MLLFLFQHFPHYRRHLLAVDGARPRAKHFTFGGDKCSGWHGPDLVVGNYAFIVRESGGISDPNGVQELTGILGRTQPVNCPTSMPSRCNSPPYSS